MSITVKTILMAAVTTVAVNGAALKITDGENYLNFKSAPTETPQVHTKIINTSSKAVNVQFVKTRIATPKGWDVSMCVGLCLPPFVDTLEKTIDAGQEVVLDVDFQIGATTAKGRAEVQFTIQNLDDKSEIYERFYGTTVGAQAEATDFGFTFDKTGAKVIDGEMTQHHISIYSNQSKAVELTLKRREVVLPQNWEVTMCVNNSCLPPFIDEIAVPLPANGKTVLDVDVTARGKGAAMVAFDLIDSASGTVKSLALAYPTYSSDPTALLGSHSAVKLPISLIQNGSEISIKLPSMGNTTIKMVDLRGREMSTIFDGVYHGDSVNFSARGFASGIYLVSVIQNGSTASIPVKF